MAEIRKRGKSYYEILGLVHSATAEEIQAAFRKLARKWHPDLCPDLKEAAANFKQVAEAFEVLGDPEKRRRYDRSQSRPRRVGGSAAAVRPNDAPPCRQYPMGPSEFDWLFGQLEAMLFPGSLWDAWQQRPPMPSPAGPSLDVDAELPITPEEARDGGRVQVKLSLHQACPDCRGQGVVAGNVCAICGGSGKVRQRPRFLTISVPAGIRNGSVLHVRGAGKVASGAGPPGDLHLRVRVRPCW